MSDSDNTSKALGGDGKYRWIVAFNVGQRFIGRVETHDLKPDQEVFTLNPAFEYFQQIKFVVGATPERQEALAPLDMVGALPFRVRPDAFYWVDSLPEWRQREVGKLLDDAIQGARAFALKKKSGIVLA